MPLNSKLLHIVTFIETEKRIIAKENGWLLTICEMILLSILLNPVSLWVKGLHQMWQNSPFHG